VGDERLLLISCK